MSMLQVSIRAAPLSRSVEKPVAKPMTLSCIICDPRVKPVRVRNEARGSMAYVRTFPQRVSDAVGGRLSRLGEWLGIESLIYNPLTFRNFHRVAVHSAPGVVRMFAQLFPEARRFVDVGAGSGAYAAAINRSPGLSCVACEHSPVGRR